MPGAVVALLLTGHRHFETPLLLLLTDPAAAQSGRTTTPSRVMEDRDSVMVEVGAVCSDQN
jgi:hypothetical protein